MLTHYVLEDVQMLQVFAGEETTAMMAVCVLKVDAAA
jgi:hypothetical protein